MSGFFYCWCWVLGFELQGNYEIYSLNQFDNREVLLKKLSGSDRSRFTVFGLFRFGQLFQTFSRSELHLSGGWTATDAISRCSSFLDVLLF